MPDHIVQPGDCVQSLADRHGLVPESVWGHPKNAELRALREKPTLLAPGDVLFIPDKQQRQEPCATASRHRFVRKSVPTQLQLRLLRNGKPRASKAYSLAVEGRVLSGQTDADGFVRQTVPAQARSATLTLTETGEVIPLALGHLDPVEEVSGIQQRLANLGHYSAGVTRRLDEPTRLALSAYQRQRGLPVTGDVDAETREALASDHKS